MTRRKYQVKKRFIKNDPAGYAFEWAFSGPRKWADPDMRLGAPGDIVFWAHENTWTIEFGFIDEWANFDNVWGQLSVKEVDAFIQALRQARKIASGKLKAKKLKAR